ncbi:ATP-binding cassette domain-containing protein [Georgenia sp. H159]|uniref:ATP-binding cassette domain-containing protein n=1 Tax=Georgenia sp. H159 TaxID=3076115 RepID=UPI002D776DCC|nr:ATP-binding cassette domain-containing protein [Georgenia sp. H159]
MDAAIEAHGVGKVFGKDAVGLRELSLEVRPGRVLALLGHNGAGKTTAVRGLSTLLRFDRGDAAVAGFDVRAQAHQVRERIGLVGQGAAVDDQLTAVQNLVLFGRLRGLDRRAAAARARELVVRFGMDDAADRPVRGFSGGMRRRLDVAAGLVVRPEVLFVDEPTTGLDPAGRRDLWQALRELVDEGTTVLLTTQYLEEADALADHVVLLAHGEVVAEGTADELKDRLGHAALRVRFTDAEEAARVLPALRVIDPDLEVDGGVVTTLDAADPGVLPACVRALAAHGVTPAELSLRKPSLDEVFLSLTEPKEYAR